MNMERQMAIENIKKWYFEQSKRHSILSYLQRYNASETLKKWYSVNWKRKFIFHYLQSRIIASVNSLVEDNRISEYSIINHYNQNCECNELTSGDEDIGKELRADNFDEELQKDEAVNIQKVKYDDSLYPRGMFKEKLCEKITLEQAILSYLDINKNSEILQYWCGDSEKRNCYSTTNSISCYYQ
ncbi:uncharacterized protein LOC111632712 isoform X1 [Centruroides sculpturatus]|uniref:uncharacterized protein LOC111632712 isoform X1 n=1 Tax=Centruroides sculpturatus TaxID=218467 RepID=UPI000C6E11BA|nr:uncharacterized protein LOC111632712 isoform X1 [Centruroides sculpturatus]XP_023232984.1 uncharacterized protein LOC111632712 isoform X1 [Centruroides sculpturatus]XP_023232985.1 uncharacterized protein LOC111632712 isoform X1 [Centruroides sculpturatus]